MINADYVYWDLSDMPMTTLYKYKDHNPGYLTCSGSGTEEKGIVQAQNNECGLQKLVLDLLSHVCATCPQRGESLKGVAP